MALTVKAIARLVEPGRYLDAHGLYMQVLSATNRSWLLRFERDGRERWMGLGPLHTVNLPEAREKARKARQQLLDGIDPIEARLAARDALRKEETEQITFKAASEKFLALHESGWRNAKHRQQWANTLKTYAYPTLGARPVKAIDAALINQALAPIWSTIPETAARVRHRIGRVLKWVEGGMPLPAPAVSKRRKNHPALPYAELPDLMGELRQRQGVSALALQFLIFTAARTGEIIGAKRDEFDFERKIWTVPASRMKAGREHRVPLSDPAIELLQMLPSEEGNDFMFIGGKPGAGLSNMALLELMRGMRPGFVPHGFRSTFKDWCSESTNFANMISEAALAHAIGDKTEAAYRRGDMIEKRRKLMEAWAKFATTTPVQASAKVVAFRKARRA
jgi:integrase